MPVMAALDRLAKVPASTTFISSWASLHGGSERGYRALLEGSQTTQISEPTQGKCDLFDQGYLSRRILARFSFNSIFLRI